jgi:isopenicillin N synthase-like dioxygenase
VIETLAYRLTCGNDVSAASVSSTTALPVVDLRDDPDALRERLRAAAHETGFCYLIGHGVAESLVGKVLEVARRFFALPQADKDAIAMVRSPHFRGYTLLGGELTRGAVDWREQVDIGPERAPVAGPGKPDYLWLQGPNQWPAGLPELRAVMAEWDAALSAVAGSLLRHWAVALGSPARDAGVLTLLLAESGSRGLQVRRPSCGDEEDGWVDVPAVEGAFIVNIGELLEVATGGYLRATEHRVVLRQPSRERISVPYFFNPRLDAQIPVLKLPAELAAQAGLHLDPADPIFSVYGRNAWKSRLRAHPDVAAAHGYSPPSNY